MTDHAGKVALVTGANKGIGYAAARQLAERGFSVIAGARERTRGESAVAQLRQRSRNVRLVMLDVTDAASVAAAAEEIRAGFGRLDVLVNNAGVLKDEGVKARDTNVATLTETLAANLHGAIRVTQAFLPLLLQSSDARIINVSSDWGSLATMADVGSEAPSYCISKAALNMWTVVLASDLKAAGIRVNSADPGWSQTDMGGAAAPRTAEDGAAIITRLATQSGQPTGGFYSDAGRVPW